MRGFFFASPILALSTVPTSLCAPSFTSSVTFFDVVEYSGRGPVAQLVRAVDSSKGASILENIE